MKQQAEKDVPQKENKEIMVEGVVGDMWADPFNDVLANICEKQSKKKEWLESIMLDLEVKLKPDCGTVGKFVREGVSLVKFYLKKQFLQHTDFLLWLPPPSLNYVVVSALIGLGQPVPGLGP